MLWNHESCRAVGGLRLGVWEEAAPRLLPRLVPTSRAGPVGRPVLVAPGHHRVGAALAWDVGIDVGAGIARVDRRLLEAWAVDQPTIWQRARANLAGRPGPAVAAIGWPPDPLLLLTGGPWTTGWLLGWPGSMAVALGHDLALVAPTPHRAAGRADPVEVGAGLLGLARHLATARIGGWPPTILTVPDGVPFVDRPILE